MYTIIIVDDEPLVLRSISNFIQDFFPSLRILGAYKSSPEALKAFQDAPSDIVLTDIRMPIMDGLELIERMQSISKNFIPVILSGYGEFSYAKKAMQLGVTYFLLKPPDYNELQQTLTAAINKLQQNQLIHARVAHSKENQELFFANLTRRQFVTSKEMEQAYEPLALPSALLTTPGVLLRISVLSAIVNYHYDLETLSNAWENLVRMCLHPEYVCTVGRISGHYDLILIGSTFAESALQTLCREARLLLELEISASALTSFPSLYEFLNIQNNVSPQHSHNSTGQYHDCIRHAISYMEEHYAEDLTRELVAGAVHISSSYFSTLFVQETGVNFLNYLTELRMKKAIALLNTNMKIHDIGRAVGYSNYRRFLSNFRNYTSYTPGEYRRDVLRLMF